VHGLDGLETNYWQPLLPSKRSEVWLFDGRRTIRRYPLPRT